MKKIILAGALVAGLAASLLAPSAAQAATTDDGYLQGTANSVTVGTNDCVDVHVSVLATSDLEPVPGEWHASGDVTDADGYWFDYVDLDNNNDSQDVEVCNYGYGTLVTGWYSIDLSYELYNEDGDLSHEDVLTISFKVSKPVAATTTLKLTKVKKYHGSSHTSAFTAVLYKSGHRWGSGHKVTIQCKSGGYWYDIKSQKTNKDSKVGWTITHGGKQHYTCRLVWRTPDADKYKTAKSSNFLLDFWKH